MIRQTHIFTDKAINNLIYHRRQCFVNIYKDGDNKIVQIRIFDKKKTANRSHKTAFKNTKLKCYRIIVKPNQHRPTAIWK